MLKTSYCKEDPPTYGKLFVGQSTGDIYLVGSDVDVGKEKVIVICSNTPDRVGLIYNKSHIEGAGIFHGSVTIED